MVCKNNSCTEFVSNALKYGGLHVDPKNWYPLEICDNSAWTFTDELKDYLEKIGFEHIEIEPGTDLQTYFQEKEIPAGSIVFYDNGLLGKETYDGKVYHFDHAAITTGINGITGPEVVDQNNPHVSGPHFIGDTSMPYKIVIFFLP